MQHFSAMAVFERDASAHRAMQEGKGLKSMASGSRQGEGGHIQVFQLVWTPPGDGDLIQILGIGNIRGRQRLSDISHKPGKGEGGVAEVNEDSHQGGVGAKVVRIFL